MTKADLLQILDALDSASAEFEQLMLDEEWFVTEVVDKLEEAATRIKDSLAGHTV